MSAILHRHTTENININTNLYSFSWELWLPKQTQYEKGTQTFVLLKSQANFVNQQAKMGLNLCYICSCNTNTFKGKSAQKGFFFSFQDVCLKTKGLYPSWSQLSNKDLHCFIGYIEQWTATLICNRRQLNFNSSDRKNIGSSVSNLPPSPHTHNMCHTLLERGSPGT